MKDKLFKEYQNILKKWDKYRTQDMKNFQQLYEWLKKNNDYEINYYSYNDDIDILLDMINMSMELSKYWYEILNENKDITEQESKRKLINMAILKYIYNNFGTQGI